MFTHINIYTYTSISLTKKSTFSHALPLPTPPKGRCTSWWQQHRACSNLPGNDVTTRLQVQLGRTGTCTEEKKLLSSHFSLSIQHHASLSLLFLYVTFEPSCLPGFCKIFSPFIAANGCPLCGQLLLFWGGGWRRLRETVLTSMLPLDESRKCTILLFFCWSWLKYLLMWKCQILA